ncbi:hypothetical protein [Halobellus salinisoli]|uniref:hypothetical protein n=1 Tax=Halobellus salinisoli TaxID=3108500 RepID=UPI00300AE56E
MSETALKRSIRRGIALLLIPLSSIGFPEFVEATLPGISQAFSVVAFAAAVLYLLGSVVWQLSTAADTPF